MHILETTIIYFTDEISIKKLSTLLMYDLNFKEAL